LDFLVLVVGYIEDRNRVVVAIHHPDEPVIGCKGDGTGAGRVGARLHLGSVASPAPDEKGQREGKVPHARTAMDSVHWVIPHLGDQRKRVKNVAINGKRVKFKLAELMDT
jgi:hypothetical protein